MKEKILLIGPLPQKGIPSSIGGATTLFEILLTYCKENNINYNLIISNKFYGKIGFIKNTIYIYMSFLIKQKGCKIIFCNVSQNGAKFLLPFCYLLTSILKKKIIFRSFGSWIGDIIKEKRFSSKILKYIFQHSNISIVETYKLGIELKSYTPNLFILPNSRKKLSPINQKKKYSKKFVFIGQVKISKGVANILRAFEELDSSFEVAIYGPIVDDRLKFIKDNPIYKGILEGSQSIMNVLNCYDVLLLPTFYEGEGHPGIIIEAYSMGLPVIASQWKSIPELLDDDETGYLVEPDNYKSIINAILKINEHNYEILSNNAFRKFSEFDSDVIHKNLFEYIDKI